MATRTIANGGGNWNSNASWVEGAFATAADDVVATGTSGNLTINVNSACRSINLTNYVGTLTHSAGVTLSIGTTTAGTGNVAVNWPTSGWTYSPVLGSSAISFVSTSATQQTINFGGKTLSTINFTGANSSYLLSTNGMALGASITHTAGTLNTNGLTVSCGSFSSTGSTARVLTLGASTISLGTNLTLTGSNLTLNANTSTLSLNNNSHSINVGVAVSFNNFSCVASGAAKTLTFTAATTLTVAGTLTLSGVNGAKLNLVSSSPTNQWNINPQGTRTISYLNVTDSNNTNVTAIDATDGTNTNGGNNTNWTFPTIPPVITTIRDGKSF